MYSIEYEIYLELLNMKIKKIMLVTFVLLAILTIGAVSASDDVASDGNLTVSDDGEA